MRTSMFTKLVYIEELHAHVGWVVIYDFPMAGWPTLPMGIVNKTVWYDYC